MKKITFWTALLVAATVFAATSFDGTYQFQSRTKKGQPDMAGWTGAMTIQNNTIDRTYRSADGKESKFYVGTLTPQGTLYVMKYTKAYKPEYVGMELKSKFILTGNRLTIESEDGTFQEVWTKK